MSHLPDYFDCTRMSMLTRTHNVDQHFSTGNSVVSIPITIADTVVSGCRLS